MDLSGQRRQGTMDMKTSVTATVLITLAIGGVVLGSPAKASDETRSPLIVEAPVVATAAAIPLTRDVNRERADAANEAAAERAVKSVLADTKLDLDIKLIGPTSVRIAGKQ